MALCRCSSITPTDHRKRSLEFLTNIFIAIESSIGTLGFIAISVAIAAILIAAAWGLRNAGFSDGIAAMTIPELAARVMQIAAMVMLCVPESNRWFAEVANLRKEDE